MTTLSVREFTEEDLENVAPKALADLAERLWENLCAVAGMLECKGCTVELDMDECETLISVKGELVAMQSLLDV